MKNAYNAEGVRVAKTVNGETEYYLTEGAAILLTLDEAGNETSRNIYGINLLQRVVGDESYTYLYNGHGDVVALTNGEGTIVATYAYDEFGNITAQTGDVDNPVGERKANPACPYLLKFRLYGLSDWVGRQPNPPLSHRISEIFPDIGVLRSFCPKIKERQGKSGVNTWCICEYFDAVFQRF